MGNIPKNLAQLLVNGVTGFVVSGDIVTGSNNSSTQKLYLTPVDIDDILEFNWDDPQLLANPDKDITIALKTDKTGYPLETGHLTVDQIRLILDAYKGQNDSIVAEEIKRVIREGGPDIKNGLFKNFKSLQGIEKALDNQDVDEISHSIRASKSSTVDTSVIEFCRTASLSDIRKFLSEITPFEQAMAIVLLEHFRPEFFSVREQIITQATIDLSAANEIVEQLNSALMFCKSSHSLSTTELTLIKYHLLVRVKDSNGIVNLRGEHYMGWIDIKAIVANPKGEILKMLVDVNHLKTPPELDIYWNQGLRPIDWKEASKFITIHVP